LCGIVVIDQNWKDKQEPDGEFQFIAISEAKCFSAEEYDSWTYCIPTKRDRSEWDLFYVLLVEEKDNYAERVGLGKVYQEAFYNSCGEGMQWKEIILG
jgi:hypothetical protein